MLFCRRNVHKLHRTMTVPFPVNWEEEVSSTMDVARDRISKTNADPIFAIIAKHQTKGRGTHGREWKSSDGNLYMTLAFDRKMLPCPLTLTPLKVGTLLVPIITSEVQSDCKVTLKWPNDVLIDGCKVCGVLIEMEKNHFVVGIGCNINSSPKIVRTGAEGARPATHVLQHVSSGDGENCDDVIDPETCRRSVAEGIVAAFSHWLCPIEAKVESATDIIATANAMMSREPQLVRLDGVAEGHDAAGRMVQPLQINADGTLQVVDGATGVEETLVSDYLW